jgi:hypothetical protein
MLGSISTIHPGHEILIQEEGIALSLNCITAQGPNTFVFCVLKNGIYLPSRFLHKIYMCNLETIQNHFENVFRNNFN